jgi:CBS-domain-containing membrane protein
VGIVTDRDIACRALADSGNLAKMTAKDVMTKDVCSPEDDVQVAIEAMEAKQIRRLPVTDGHKTMIGMLTSATFRTRSAKTFRVKCCGRSQGIMPSRQTASRAFARSPWLSSTK